MIVLSQICKMMILDKSNLAKNINEVTESIIIQNICMFCWWTSNVQMKDKKMCTSQELLYIYPLKFIFLSSFQQNH
jgi:hypothetical protein